MTTLSPTIEKILKEFRKAFLMKGSGCTWESYPNPEELESFLTEKLQEVERGRHDKCITRFESLRERLDNIGMHKLSLRQITSWVDELSHLKRSEGKEL